MTICRWVACLLAAGSLCGQPSELARFASRPDIWPKEVSIKTAQVVGKTQIPAGAKTKVVGLEGTLLGIEYNGVFAMVPADQTDFLEKASVALAQKPQADSPKSSGAPSNASSQPRTGTPPISDKTGRAPHRLVALENDLVFADGMQVLPGSLKLATADYVLLQFGGGATWQSAMNELIKAFIGARDRKAALEVIMVPQPGLTVAQAGELLRENRAAWPTVNARNQRLVNALWETYGHAGSFALCLVDPEGKIVVRTRAGAGRIEDFLYVIKAIDELGPRR